ncbi:MAG: rRNA pseudouridine synthase [Chitinophagia bacterium]|nr:rRNA pseudouridine synthase [Chitinophagia bacterium]
MKRTDNFSKFATKKKNSAVKEAFRQEKKKWKKERSEAIEKKKIEKRESISITKSKSSEAAPITLRKQDKSMPLNKYVAHCGVCSRRDAVALIKEGKLKVNNEVILEPGFKVAPEDTVHFSGKKIFPEKNLVYILLNKPKDYITTLDDPEGRKTVLDLLKGATNERVFPVGRLDRNTTGVLLLTNDGDMTQKLSHPSHEVRKIYEVKLDKPLGKVDFEKILQGLNLDDGFVRADALAYSDPKDKSVVGIELHSGRNRIVRRMFEYLGYDVRNLDRVMFGNLTKKNVERGKWRFLNEKEIRLLKFMNSSFVKKPAGGWSEEEMEDEKKPSLPQQKRNLSAKQDKSKSIRIDARKTNGDDRRTVKGKSLSVKSVVKPVKAVVKPVKSVDKQEVVLKKWEEKLSASPDASSAEGKPQRKRVPLKPKSNAPLKVVKRK